MKVAHLLGPLTLVLLLALAIPASASLISTTGLTVDTPGPGTVITSNFIINNGLPSQIIFDEQQGVTLAAPLVTDTGTIAAGTTVDSAFVALNSSGEFVVDTNATFDGPVLGIIYLDGSANYAASDFLGLPSLTYAESCGNCGFEPGDTASFVGATALFHTDYSEPGDFARVITLAAPAGVPEPASLVLMGSGLAALASRLRKR